MFAGGFALALMLLLFALPADALSFPWFPAGGRGHHSSSGPAASRLQEVAPPGAVQQLRLALDERLPRLEILSPQADSLLPAGPWTLRLRLEDWPLVDAGPMGLGPHVVVQLDGQEPLRLTSLETTMPPLSPGSHRLTVYAARPWGEAVKSPGAYRQIRFHRGAPNPLALPRQGSAQLIPVSPQGSQSSEPVLLDWLLIDAPLQNLPSGEAGWRLRVTVDNDSFLVDRQTPLWLKGWQPGPSAVLLELVDRRGEPLNPPFNSVVTEVTLASMVDPPRWLGTQLAPEELEILLGERPVEPENPVVDPPPTELEAQTESDFLAVPIPQSPELEPPAPPGALQDQPPSAAAEPTAPAPISASEQEDDTPAAPSEAGSTPRETEVSAQKGAEDGGIDGDPDPFPEAELDGTGLVEPAGREAADLAGLPTGWAS